MKIHGQTILMLAVLFTVSGSVLAQEGWKSRPYKEWTKDDIVRIASDSPWARVQQVTPSPGDIVPSTWVPGVTARLRSSSMIRWALVRLKQIEARYDKMGEKQRAEFDSKMKGLIECPACTDNYIITLGPPVSQRQMKNGLPALVNIDPGLLERRVYIANEKGERRELVHFVAPKHDEDEATFFFPRLDQRGLPLLSPENKKLLFIFEAMSLRTGLHTIPERIEFDVSKMVVNGKVEF